MLGKKVNDPEIVNMDAVTWNWHYASWVEYEMEKIEVMRDFGCFVGGFFNPEAARSIQNTKNNQIASSDDDFDKSCDFVKRDVDKNANKNIGKKRKKIKIRK